MAVDRDAEHLELIDRDRARWRVVGQPLDAQEHPVAEELRRQRRHGQVQALDAQARQAEQDAEHRGTEPAEDDRRDQRHARHADKEVEGAVRADRHEGARAQRDLAAVADQDIHSEGRQRHDQERDQDGAKEIVGCQGRDEHESASQQHQHEDAVLQDREDLLVGPVAGLELAVFAVKHISIQLGSEHICCASDPQGS
jgi:hypothetical protein